VLLLLGTVAAAAAAAAAAATGEATVSRVAVAVAAAGAAHAVCLIERRERCWRRRGSGTTCADETDRPTTPACGPPTVVHACMLGCQAFAHDEGLPPRLFCLSFSLCVGGRWLTAVTVGGSRPGAGRCLQAVASWVN
jgi:hypothetical protein